MADYPADWRSLSALNTPRVRKKQRLGVSSGMAELGRFTRPGGRGGLNEIEVEYEPVARSRWPPSRRRWRATAYVLAESQHSQRRPILGARRSLESRDASPICLTA
jgi:hypothetical protein